MDALKAQVRGNRGMRRKQVFRVASKISRYYSVPENASKRVIGKMAATRKQCDCFICQSPDHSRSISALKAHEAMIDQLAEAEGIPE